MVLVILTAEAAEQYARLPTPIQGRMRKLFIRLESWPDVSGVKPLSGALTGCFRLRTGDYRLRFRLMAGSIVIDRMGHRKDVYDD